MRPILCYKCSPSMVLERSVCSDMFYCVYILLSKKDKKLYVGCTRNLRVRLIAHNSGSVGSTKHRRPFVVIHRENFDSKADAFKRERFLKSLWSARFKKRLKDVYLK